MPFPGFSCRRVLAAACALFLAAVPARADGTLAGTARDASGAPLAGARLQLLTANQHVAATVTAAADGRFAFPAVAEGRYVLVASFPGLAERRQAVKIAAEQTSVEVALEPERRAEEVTVTATPGRVSTTDDVPQQVNVIGEERIGLLVKTVLAEVASEEPGLYLQRTSPTMGAVFVRGLVGNKVNLFVDGVRYSTSAARGGVNTFFNLIDPSMLETVEVLRGPNGAEYGSDALGGSVQLLTRGLGYSSEGSTSDGRFSTWFNSADTGFGSTLSGTWSGRRLALMGSLNGRRVNTLRPGGGFDSHNAVTRFLGLPSEPLLDGGRLPDTGFTQYGGLLKGTWSPATDSNVSFSYMRGQQDGGKRYDQLQGGDGNLVADLRNLMLDHAQVRYNHLNAGPFQDVSIGYSYNSQREERVNQGGNGNPTAAINHEYERTNVHGVQAHADLEKGRHALRFGAEAFHETVNAPSFGANPATGAVTVRRGRVPDEARFDSGGIYAQDVYEAIAGRLTVMGSVRLGGASYESLAADSPIVEGNPLWRDDALDMKNVGFRIGLVFTPASRLSLTANVARGFRAPHITDLGTFGLTGAGFEVSSSGVAGLGGTVGTRADAQAVSTGRAVEELRAETSLNWEGGLRYRSARIDTDLAAFVNDIHGNIAKQALILPAGAVGTHLGDQVVSTQNANGVVFVPVTSTPVLVGANFDRVRILGVEHTLRVRMGGPWSASTAFTWLRSRDRETHLPPNIEGGTPPTEGYLTLRYAPHGGKAWVESYLHAAAEQDDLSTLDLDDRRTGAGRSRASIESFFRNGARARGLVGNGPDGRPNTADDVLLSTGETLAQVQDRVLGAGVNSAPLFRAVHGYVTVGARGGVRFGSHEVMVDLYNLTDRNYRGPSWGIDAPGRGVYLRYSSRF